MRDLKDVWVYLSANPLLHLTLTLIAFQVGHYFYRRSGMNPFLNPVLLAILIIAPVLLLSGTSYQRYFEGAQFVHFLLGPATVSLAIPLYKQFARLRRSAGAIAISLIAGSLTAAISSVGIAWLLGGSRDVMITLAPKSVTAPVAMGIAERLGGLASLTAVLVILTGMLGAILGPPLLNILGIRNWAAQGLALGTASHGIATARAIEVNALSGAFAGLAMGLNALATSLLLPLLWKLLIG